MDDGEDDTPRHVDGRDGAYAVEHWVERVVVPLLAVVAQILAAVIAAHH